MVLEGTITALRGDPGAPERDDAGPGEAVAIPGGRPTRSATWATARARYITLFSPPGGMEGFIAGAAEALAGAGEGPPPPELVELVMGLAAAHGMTMFPPPG
jgi:hypothetical protein